MTIADGFNDGMGSPSSVVRDMGFTGVEVTLCAVQGDGGFMLCGDDPAKVLAAARALETTGVVQINGWLDFANDDPDDPGEADDGYVYMDLEFNPAPAPFDFQWDKEENDA